MPPPTSLRSLTEPAYVLLGGLLPADGSDGVKILRSPEEILLYPAEARPVLTYLSVLRSFSDAVPAITAWGGEEDDLGDLTKQGLLIRFPAGDEPSVRDILAPLTVRVPGDVTTTSDRSAVLLHLGDDRAVMIGWLTAAVLDEPTVRSLGQGVAAVAGFTGLDQDDVWREVVFDLTAVLSSGAGHLAMTPKAPIQPWTPDAHVASTTVGPNTPSWRDAGRP